MKRVVVVLKPKGESPVYLVMPGGSKVLQVTKMTNKEVDKAEDQGDTFLNFKLP